MRREGGGWGHVSHYHAGTHREGIVLADCCPQVTVRTDEITVETLIDGNLFDGVGLRWVLGSVIYVFFPQGIGRDQTDISSLRGIITKTGCRVFDAATRPGVQDKVNQSEEIVVHLHFDLTDLYVKLC